MWSKVAHMARWGPAMGVVAWYLVRPGWVTLAGLVCAGVWQQAEMWRLGRWAGTAQEMAALKGQVLRVLNRP